MATAGKDELEQLFPNLKDTPDFRIASPCDTRYNCIAWAAGSKELWWEPDPYGYYYWPKEAPRQYTLDAYVSAFAALGYERCDDDLLAPDFEKVAIYALDLRPTHAARQIASGMWTSKIGKNVDIEHTLAGLEGSFYGKVAVILRRPRDPSLLSTDSPTE
ncbi:MAG: hypothetical protein ABIH23_05920 [bacterium]